MSLVVVSSKLLKQLDCRRLWILILLVGRPFLQSWRDGSLYCHSRWRYIDSNSQIIQRDFQQHFVHISVWVLPTSRMMCCILKRILRTPGSWSKRRWYRHLLGIGRRASSQLSFKKLIIFFSTIVSKLNNSSDAYSSQPFDFNQL
jgi:hypothetical protein